MSRQTAQSPAPARAVHELRPSAAGNNRRRRPAAVASTAYPPGYFTALLWPATNWPFKGWKPAAVSDAEVLARKRSMAGHTNATAGVEAGTIKCMVALPGTPKTAPDMVAKLRAWRPSK